MKNTFSSLSRFFGRLVLLCLISITLKTSAQDLPGTVGFDDFQRYHNAIRVMFYNVENLFDLEHDSLKNDMEFLPGGSYNWSKSRLYNKIQNISKVMIACGGWEAPEIIGLCEVENRKVLLQLLRQSPLSRYPYRIVHYESPDNRGIDNALLYRTDKFTMIHSQAFQLIFEGDSVARTRDILYVKGLAMHKDTLHFLVNHWPSKFGGHVATDPLRCQAGKLLRSITDSILESNPDAAIVMMGDFNDEPGDESVKDCLGASTDISPDSYQKRINLMGPLKKLGAGTHAFNNFSGWEYSLIDHFIVSPALLHKDSGLRVRENRAWIFAAPFMIETTDDGAQRPFRTFVGRTYKGGYSDHYPIFLDILLN
jgi:endonuclease/exonuclease/phosphatase family metal-dependent hydrolase